MEAQAQCGCGRVTIKVSAAPVAQLVCHCKECRAFTGMPFVKAAFFKRDDCSVSGETRSETVRGGTGAAKQHHCCAACDEPVYVQVEALNGAVAVFGEKLSSFEFVAQAHIWTSEKAPGVAIPDGAPQSAGAPPAEIVDHMVAHFWGGAAR